MEDRRAFLEKLAAFGIGSVAALKKSIPEAEVHKIEQNATYLIVIPNDWSVHRLEEFQAYLDQLKDDRLPLFILMPLGKVEGIFKL